MQTKRIPANPAHKLVHNELAELLDRHAGELPALEVLAIAANMVGQLVAMQDQRTMPKERALEIVAENVENGNRFALAALDKPRGSA